MYQMLTFSMAIYTVSIQEHKSRWAKLQISETERQAGNKRGETLFCHQAWG